MAKGTLRRRGAHHQSCFLRSSTFPLRGCSGRHGGEGRGGSWSLPGASRCLLRAELFPSRPLQRAQLWGLSPACVLRCSWKRAQLLKLCSQSAPPQGLWVPRALPWAPPVDRCPHSVHRFGFSPAWALWWAPKLDESLKLWPQSRHLKGLSPVWVLWCLARLLLLPKHFPHTRHLWAFSFWRVARHPRRAPRALPSPHLRGLWGPLPVQGRWCATALPVSRGRQAGFPRLTPCKAPQGLPEVPSPLCALPGSGFWGAALLAFSVNALACSASSSICVASSLTLTPTVKSENKTTNSDRSCIDMNMAYKAICYVPVYSASLASGLVTRPDPVTPYLHSVLERANTTCGKAFCTEFQPQRHPVRPDGQGAA